MGDEVKQRIAKYADNAYAAASHDINQKTMVEIAQVKEQLASKGLVSSSVMVREMARVHGDRVNGLVQAKADALVDAYELYGGEFDDSILEQAVDLRSKLISEISDNPSFVPPAGASQLFLSFLNANTSAIINTISCQLEQRKVVPKFKKGGSHAIDEDRRFALMAIEEARKSISEDERPHPKVGAVVVKEGKVVSKAHRGENPKSHAEYIALEGKLSDDLVAGATVYTTLEPCTTRNHPKIPCAQRLVDRKVARVVIGMLDPNPEIRGLGEQLLSEANIETQLFPRDLKAQVEEMNREFIRAQKQKQIAKPRLEPKENAAGGRLSVTDPKVEAILSFKGKVVTVLSRQKYGHGFLEGYWANGAVVVDCTTLWVVLQDPSTKDHQTFSLTKVTVTFDNQNNRLRLEIER
jgi:pyrimidine deaminase RibD-like protein